MIKLGPAGSPCRSTLEGISFVKDHNLQALEVEFVRGIHMSNNLAKQIGQLAKKLDIELSVHAPYYINLNSEEKSKLNASKKRIVMSCERGHYLGAQKIVFHPGFYGKKIPEQTYENIKQAILEIQKEIKKEHYNVELAPETTGKVNVFGSLDEILKLKKETGCNLCIDFAHIYARNQGKINYAEILDKVKLKNLHCHFSGINFTKKGERNHLIMNHHPDFRPLAKEILKRNLSVTIISESPTTWHDSLNMKKIFENFGYRF